MDDPLSRTVTALLVTTMLAAGASTQTTVVVPCVLDTTLYEDATGSFGNSLGESLFVGVTAQGRLRRALVKFDIAAAVPVGARVVAAELDLNVIQSGASQGADVGGHRVLAPWGEGTSYAITGGGGQGAPSTNGDATWIHATYPAVSWTTAGGDFVATPSFVVSMPTAGAFRSPPSTQSTADVQSWLDQPTQNFGWLLKAEVETVQAARARRLDSRESLGSKPVLRVTYLLAGQSATWGTGCATANGTFGFSFVGAMVGGTTIQLAHTNGPTNSVGANFFALDIDAPGSPFLPGCSLHLPVGQSWITGFLVLLDGTGNGSAAWTLPTTYPGLFFVSQSVALDTTPLGLSLSNAGVAVLQ